MDITQIPLFSMLRGKLGYLSEKQRLIAQNVANAETPGYRPQDLKPFNFQSQIQMAQSSGGLATTNSGHIAMATTASGSRFKAKRTEDSETTLDGNSVVLEEEMLKMSDARMNYDAAIGFYQKSLNLLRMASRPPGR